MLEFFGNTLIELVVEEILLILFSGFFCYQLKRYRPSNTHAFLCGLGIGVATLLWYWAAIGIIIILLVVFGALKVYSRQIFWNIIFGFVTPLWLYLPYYLYKVINVQLSTTNFQP